MAARIRRNNLRLALLSAWIVCFSCARYVRPVSTWGHGETKALASLNDANRFYLENDFDQALQAARHSLREMETVDALYLSAISLLQLGKREQGIDYLKRANRLAPRDKRVLSSLANALHESGDVDRAFEIDLALFKLNPGEPIYSFRIAEALKSKKLYDRALAYYDRADAKGIAFREKIHLSRGEIALERRRINEAISHFEKALEVNPDFSPAKQSLQYAKMFNLLFEGNAALREKKYDRAHRLFSEAAARSPDYWLAHHLAGVSLLALGRPKDAVVSFKKSIALDADSPESRLLLGSAYRALGRYRDSISVLLEAKKRFPANAEVSYRLGLSYRRAGDPKRARSAFLDAVYIKRDFAQGFLELGSGYMEEGLYSEAEEMFKKVINLEPGNRTAANALRILPLYQAVARGDRFFDQKEYEKADAAYRDALKIGRLPVVLNALARLEFARKDYARAESYYREILRGKDPDMQSLRGLITLCKVTGERELQKEAEGKLHSLSKTDLVSALRLGARYEREGRYAEAERYYKTLLRMHRGEEAVPARLSRLYLTLGNDRNAKGDLSGSLRFFNQAAAYAADSEHIKEMIRSVEENMRIRALSPLLRKAESYSRQNNPAEALKLYQVAAQKVRRPQIFVKMAECYFALGNERDGEKVLRDAQKAYPDSVAVAEAIHSFELKQGDLARARSGFEEILRRDDDAYYSHYKLGVIAVRENHYNKAIFHFTKSLAYNPDFFAARIARGVAYYRSGKMDLAKLDFESAGNRNDELLGGFNLGMMLYNDGVYDRAEGVFLDIVRENPQFCEAHYHLAYIYYDRHDYELARSHLRACLNQNDAKYYMALVRINDERIEKKAAPSLEKETRKLCREIVQRFPGTKEANECRGRLERSEERRRVLYPYPVSGEGVFSVLAGGVLFVHDGVSLSATEETTKRVLWKSYLPGVVSMAPGPFLYALTEKRLSFLDWDTGEEVAGIPMREGKAKQVIGFPSGAVVLGRSLSDRSYLKRFDLNGDVLSSVSSIGADDFHFAGKNLFRTKAAKLQTVIERLDAGSLAPVSTVTLRHGDSVSSPSLSGGRDALFVIDDRGFAMYNAGSLQQIARHDVSIGAVKEYPSYCLAATEYAFLRIDSSGAIVKTVPYRSGLFAPDSFKGFPDGRILYFDAGRVLRMVDREGVELWSQQVDRSPNRSFFSVYDES